MVALFFLFLVYLRAESHILNLANNPRKIQPNWKIELQTADPKLLTDKHRSIIDRKVEKHLLTGSRDELQYLAQSILTSTVFDKVSIKRNQANHLLIDLTIPSPLAVIQVDTFRFLSTNGTIFGEVDEESMKNFVTIEGVFANNKEKIRFNKTNKVVISEAQQESINGILKFLKDTKSTDLQISKLIFNHFRGISLKLKNDIFVSLGHGPYSKKMSRLVAILINADKKGDKIDKVELDFAGKAFIQKKKFEQEL